MKYIVAAVWATATFWFCGAMVRGDETSVRLTVNGTTGHHVESDRTESIPFLPLPTIELEHTHKDFRIHLEGLPPIGPIPLAQSNQFTESIAPRVSYINAEILYAPKRYPFAFGIGETVLNQQTSDRVPFLSNGASIHYSRVVGLRFAGRATLYSDARNRFIASIAVNPSMHGLEDGVHAEYASLVDSSLCWRIADGRYGISYGVRYLNYAAAYADHSLADRNHLFMPFIGIDWSDKHDTAASQNDDPPAISVRHPQNTTTIGLSLFGSNGNRTFTQAYSDTPLSFALIPSINVAHTAGRFEIQAQGILPNAGPNPFGASHNSWSYLNADALAEIGRGPLAFGLGETVTNIEPVKKSPGAQSGTRSEAVDFVTRVRFEQTGRSNAYVQLRLNPYIHVSSSTTFTSPDQPSRIFTSIAHGARVDAMLWREIAVKRLVFEYGLRYINQTTNYSGAWPNGYLTRSSSLMPFIGFGLSTPR